MKINVKLKWAFPRFLFWVTILLIIVFPLIGLFWFLFKFNLPFINAGDKWVGILIIAVWWLSCSFNLFGWSLRAKNNNFTETIGRNV